jgi:hypothetical protein
MMGRRQIMNRTNVLSGIVAATILLAISSPIANAQTRVIQEADTVRIYVNERNLGGPRMGVTIVPGNGELVDNLRSHGVGRAISQFGWHFENRLRFQRNGPAFVIEFVPLFAGVEYGKFIPSASLLLGIRLPTGFEFGMGPNVLAGGKNGVSSALVVAIGQTLDYAGVSIPFNLAYVTSPAGNRVGLIFGYAI